MKQILQAGSWAAALLVLQSAWSAEPSAMFRIQQGGKVGFINQAGKVVIPPKLPTGTGQFSESVAMVSGDRAGGGFGCDYVGLDGTMLNLARSYQGVDDFKEGRAAVLALDKYGYIDQRGNMVIPPRFRYATQFSEGLAAVTIADEQAGYIDRTGKTVIAMQYAGTTSFSEGLGRVSVHTGSGFMTRSGCVDKHGKIVIPIEYDTLLPCREGIVVAFKAGKCFGLDTNGTVVLRGEFKSLWPFHEGLAQADKDGLWGFVDHAGKWVIPAQFENCAWFSEGLAGVKEGGKWGVRGMD